MPGILRTVASRVAPVLRGHTVTQSANMYTRPAKEKIGFVESSIACAVFSATILGPSGWVLAHLEDYKKRD
ncbi:PREDICTED: cytochrome c oxidase subunit 8A, mitochondrial-like [Poecilia mexicana]|uniref:Cytochrome c oxidase subunit 8A, mitochondrial n=1 Tax=Poecilia mexicana TaxID=48701 RepID=A0A3B3YSH0_9TELE|nr:PREDICTED: cytochrome c oxidase subunit 8A, mitochondrial-like [Poecilia mexicana]XP_014856722.1 PREDICTED: cytochrome c oxidase subunit 8A, mitochondrial-like [Poecilia mexicana]